GQSPNHHICGFLSGTKASSSRSYRYVNESLRRKARIQQGEVVAMMLEADTAHRAIRTPQGLKDALDREPQAAERYAHLAYSHKKAYVEWIQAAKRAETRARRIRKAVEMIRGGKPLKG
ncbi:MAG: YdeI/OmpD-associated family protein, partial [Anaerolineales bacterium]|nr:YdeI/OmpD-associated family protein [Anaerolineales bacterium]